MIQIILMCTTICCKSVTNLFICVTWGELVIVNFDQLSGLNHIHHILKCHFIKFMQSLSNSNNNKLVHLYNISHKNKQSPSGLNIASITCEYSVKSCDIHQCNMLTQMNKIYEEKSMDLGNDQWKINSMNELKLLKVAYYGF